MSTNSQDQEIDLGQITAGIKNFFNNCINAIFDFIFFVKKKIIIIAILIITGAILGYFQDKKLGYEQKMILTPNFGSNEYLYNNVDLLASKLKEGDSVFFKSIGVKNADFIGKIAIKPINGIYNFVNSKDNVLNFEFIKLMAEDGNIEKIIKDDLTSRNFYQHELTINTSKPFKKEDLLEPILKFLQNSEYYEKIKVENQKNIEEKIAFNNVLIKQIDDLIVSYSQNKPSGSVTISENSGLSDIINKKDALIKENQQISISRISYDKIIKDQSIVANQIKSKGFGNNQKIIFPVLFVFIYFALFVFISLYKKQLKRVNS